MFINKYYNNLVLLIELHYIFKNFIWTLSVSGSPHPSLKTPAKSSTVVDLYLKENESFGSTIPSNEAFLSVHMMNLTGLNPFFFMSSADKHKLERFLRPDAPTVMSVYAPITFPTAGVLVFKQRDNGGENQTQHLIQKENCLHQYSMWFSFFVVPLPQVCRTWWPQVLFWAAILGVWFWRESCWVDTLSKSTGALLWSVTCSSTEVRTEALVISSVYL